MPGRLTAAEYAKTHGAAAAAQLHKERQARTARINKVAQRQVAAKQSFAQSLPGRLMSVGTARGHLSYPKSRNDFKSLFLRTKFNVVPSEGSKKGQPLLGAMHAWSGNLYGDYKAKKERGFKGWSRNQQVDLASLQHNNQFLTKWVNGWEANRRYNKMSKAAGLPKLIKNEKLISGKDLEFDKNNSLYKLAAKKLGKPYEYHALKPEKRHY